MPYVGLWQAARAERRHVIAAPTPVRYCLIASADKPISTSARVVMFSCNSTKYYCAIDPLDKPQSLSILFE
jgi:hypothetical protein